MATTPIPKSTLEKKIMFFKKHGIPYQLEGTNTRLDLKAEGRWGHWTNKGSKFNPKFLSFIKKVRDHIINNETYKNVKNNFKNEERINRIKYFFYNKKYSSGAYFENIKEIDLKGAYWNQLNKLPGVITEELFNEGNGVDKDTRLACVGTMARSKWRIKFDGKEEIFLPDLRSEKTEFLWHTISWNIGKLMNKARIAAKNDFIFFWVDAIFVHGDRVNEVVEVFKNAGFESKIINCESVRFDDKKIIVKSKEKGKWLYKKERTKITLPNGRPGIKIVTEKIYTDERPFPYKNTLTENDIIKLSVNQ